MLLVEYLANMPLLGTLSPGQDTDVVLLRLSPSECFEQDEVVLYKLLFPLLIWGRNDEGIAVNGFELAWLNRVEKAVGLKSVVKLCEELRPDREAQMLVQDEFITFELDHKARTKAMVSGFAEAANDWNTASSLRRRLVLRSSMCRTGAWLARK